jgi:chromosome segregation ATPase
MATKAQEIYEEVEKRIAAGVEKADAFKALAEETGRPFDSLRGSYYGWKRKLEGGEPNAKPARTRRRSTTPDDALADARAALERAIGSIEREIEGAKARADEAQAEYEALRDSAKERKEAISTRLEALN